jgi:hypothetical protein
VLYSHELPAASQRPLYIFHINVFSLLTELLSSHTTLTLRAGIDLTEPPNTIAIAYQPLIGSNQRATRTNGLRSVLHILLNIFCMILTSTQLGIRAIVFPRLC